MNSMLPGEATHSAKAGVIFHTTRVPVSDDQPAYGKCDGRLTCPCGPPCAIRRQNGRRLMHSEVAASDAQLQDGRLGVDETEAMGREVLGEQFKGF